jgi:hypothetical protein
MSLRGNSARALCLAGLAAIALSGCVVNLDDLIDGSDDQGGQTDTQITVRVVNTTNVTLDPEIYVSAEPVSVADLFRARNKYTAYGVGTTGILADFDSDTFTLDCSEVRVIGVRGGAFGDDLNNPDGTGDQVVLTQDLNIFCGGSVTFTYSRSGGEFTTSYTVTR